MRRQVARRVLLKKGAVKQVSRGVSSSNTNSGGARSSFYNQILARGGRAKVCVIRKFGGIGDLLMITPSLRQLKRDFPHLQLQAKDCLLVIRPIPRPAFPLTRLRCRLVPALL